MADYSIILPVRNGGALVKQCVQSILAQQYEEFELIVLDNNSTDGTPEWITSLNDSRITIFPSGKDLSIVENWARIKYIPKKEFITLIGHDDILYPHYLTAMGELIKKHPEASLYQAHYNFIDGSGNFTGPCLPMDEKQYGHEFLACQMARTMNSMGTGYMMRSAAYDRLGGIPQEYPNLIFADYELWLKLGMISYKATTSKFCFSYRVHKSASTLTNGDQYQQAFGQYINFLTRLRKEDKMIAEIADHYGHNFIMYFCESLSHRILKTPVNKRQVTVKDFVKKCEAYAAMLIPGQSFSPLEKKRISLAQQLDANAVGRVAFKLAKKAMNIFGR